MVGKMSMGRLELPCLHEQFRVRRPYRLLRHRLQRAGRSQGESAEEEGSEKAWLNRSNVTPPNHCSMFNAPSLGGAIHLRS